jgi:hypothetical protein
MHVGTPTFPANAPPPPDALATRKTRDWTRRMHTDQQECSYVVIRRIVLELFHSAILNVPIPEACIASS